MQEGGKLVLTCTAMEHGIWEGIKPAGIGVSPWKTRLEMGLGQLQQVCEQPTHTGSVRAEAGQGGGEAREDTDAWRHHNTFETLTGILRIMLLTVTTPLEGCKAEPVTAKADAQSSQDSPVPCHRQTMHQWNRWHRSSALAPSHLACAGVGQGCPCSGELVPPAAGTECRGRNRAGSASRRG